jgi:tetratricopeptide (TPR) repeat protein
MAKATAMADLGQAVATLEQLGARFTDLCEPWREAGVGWSMLGRFDKALACFDKAIAIAPNDPANADSKAVALLQVPDLEAALEVLEAGLRACPEAAVLHYRRGVCLLLLKRFEQALAPLDHSLQLDPERVEALGMKGDALAKLGRTASAIECMERLVALRPGSENKTVRATRRELWRLKHPGANTDTAKAHALVTAASRAANEQQPDVAARTFEQALQADPTSGRAWFAFADFLRRRGQWSLALAGFESTEYWLGPTVTVAEGRAECLFALHRPDEAVACAQRAVAFPGVVISDARRLEARVLGRAGRWAEAVTVYQGLVAQNHTDPGLVDEWLAAVNQAGASLV